MKKAIYIKLDGVLIDTRETFRELYKIYNNKDIIVDNFNYRKYFEDEEEFQSFFELHGQQLYNNKNIYREELNELISTANECLYPVYIFQEKFYQKQSYHIINLLARQKNLIINGFFLDTDAEINKTRNYIYDKELIIGENFDVFDNPLCNFLKDIEQEIKKEIQ